MLLITSFHFKELGFTFTLTPLDVFCQSLCHLSTKNANVLFFCLLGKKDGTYNSVNDPEILEIRDDNSIGKRGAYETDYFSRGNENFSFIQ